ncbi:hypothetical protein [Nonomuraea salmonea]
MKTALVAAVAVSSTIVGALPAHAANRDNCRGNVSSIYTSGSAVVASYVIVCDRTQSHIVVSADVTRQEYPLANRRATKTCYNAVRCSVQPRITNKTGRQLYSGAVFGAIARRGSYIAGCGYVQGLLSGGLSLDALMTCRAKDKYL